MDESLWQIEERGGPLFATAIHNGHEVRSEVGDLLALNPSERLREEDPFTGLWTSVAGNRIVAQRSRFEVDLNRPREKAVYVQPEDAWGLNVWKSPPPQELIQRSLDAYDAFYAEARRICSALAGRHGRFVVLDFHSYNHRRAGATADPEDPVANPEVNVGTGTMVRERWAPIVNRFIRELREAPVLGRQLDVRENVRFRGGNWPRWIHETFPQSGCALAIEFKKTFMDEWTGEEDSTALEDIHAALYSTVPGILEELEKLEPGGSS